MAEKQCGLFRTRLSVEHQGNKLRLDFSLVNVSGRDLGIYFCSGQKFDIVVYNGEAEEIYRWSHNKSFICRIINYELKKQEELSFSEVWDCTDNDGKAVAAGRYLVKVEILARLKDSGITVCPDELSASAVIEVG